MFADISSIEVAGAKKLIVRTSKKQKVIYSHFFLTFLVHILFSWYAGRSKSVHHHYMETKRNFK
jgi:hypothetical protein